MIAQNYMPRQRFWLGADGYGRTFLFDGRPIWNKKRRIWLEADDAHYLSYIGDGQLPPDIATRLTPGQCLAVTIHTEIRYLMATCQVVPHE